MRSVLAIYFRTVWGLLAPALFYISVVVCLLYISLKVIGAPPPKFKERKTGFAPIVGVGEWDVTWGDASYRMSLRPDSSYLAVGTAGDVWEGTWTILQGDHVGIAEGVRGTNVTDFLWWADLKPAREEKALEGTAYVGTNLRPDREGRQMKTRWKLSDRVPEIRKKDIY